MAAGRRGKQGVVVAWNRLALWVLDKVMHMMSELASICITLSENGRFAKPNHLVDALRSVSNMFLNFSILRIKNISVTDYVFAEGR
jgi:hypothetical protein